MPTPYQYDPLGTYPPNKIVNEVHAVVAPTSMEEANFIVPDAAPFFEIGLIVKTGPAPSDPVLAEGTDYILTHRFVEASQSLNRQVYGSITFLNNSYSGTVYLTYQTLGGTYTLPDYSIVENLTRSLYSIRVVTWTQVVPMVAAFPPLPHPHHSSDLTGMADVVDILVLIKNAIQASGANLNTLAASFTQHLIGAASHTKDQVGLNNLPNYRAATQQDIDNAVPNALVTPQMLVHAIYRYNNSGVQMLDASETIKGISRFATDIEASNFIAPADNIVISPATLLAALVAYDITKQIPVGDYYFTGSVSRDPATFLGYGTWERVKGKFMVGYDDTDPQFNTAGATGGFKQVTLTASNLPPFSTTITLPGRTGTGGSVGNSPGFSLDNSNLGNVDVSVEIKSTAADPIDILPPFFVLCIWKRTA